MENEIDPPIKAITTEPRCEHMRPWNSKIPVGEYNITLKLWNNGRGPVLTKKEKCTIDALASTDVSHTEISAYKNV